MYVTEPTLVIARIFSLPQYVAEDCQL